MLKLLEITKLFFKKHPWIIFWTRLCSVFNNQITINQKSISQHYEFDNDFYLTFLDQTRTYSHGIFMHDAEQHEHAAIRKLEFAMKSCHLVGGEKVLDIGAGWGNIVEYLGQKGIHVDAVTLSHQSEAFIAKLIKDKKLSGCRVFRKDFLEYQLAPGERYDALFSLGTLEHYPIINAC